MKVTRELWLARNIALLALLLGSLPALCVSGGCGVQTSKVVAPYIPPAYYNCTEVKPDDLVFEYWNPHRDVLTAKRLFDGRIFVFKSIEVDKNLLKNRQEGFIWINFKIHCQVTNAGDLLGLKAGDFIDVVGTNAGVASDFYGLEFTACVVLPADLVKLPADTSTFSSGY
jgi:hypothetical protein